MATLKGAASGLPVFLESCLAELISLLHFVFLHLCLFASPKVVKKQNVPPFAHMLSRDSLRWEGFSPAPAYAHTCLESKAKIFKSLLQRALI